MASTTIYSYATFLPVNIGQSKNSNNTLQYNPPLLKLPKKALKASANKNAIGVFAIQTHQKDPRKKFRGESLSEVRKMLGCLNCKYADCIFIRPRLLS